MKMNDVTSKKKEEIISFIILSYWNWLNCLCIALFLSIHEATREIMMQWSIPSLMIFIVLLWFAMTFPIIAYCAILRQIKKTKPKNSEG